MSVNIWNLSQTKTTFLIRQRTEAQRRHLNSLKKIKSNIDMKNFAHTFSLFNPLTKSHMKQKNVFQKPFQISSDINQDCSIIQSATGKVKNSMLNTSYVDNLRISSSLSRIRQNKQIQRENNKLIERLIKAKPSISDLQFRKNHIKHLKYKQNILKFKYINPDYTDQVNCTKKSRSHLLLKPIQNLKRIQQNQKLSIESNSNANRYKTLVNEGPKSQNYRFTRKLNTLQNRRKY